MPDLVSIRRALISVSDKAGLLDLARTLAHANVEIISTGGTASTLRDAGIRVTPIEDVTGFPEIMGGRVKTLHPKVHGGLLALRDDAGHLQAMKQHAIAPIDLVCVNLYPFEQTIARPNCTEHEAIENIDIGGPSMLRSAAKNFEYVTVLSKPAQYARFLEAFAANHGATPRDLRARLAAEVFTATSRYDATIAAYLSRAPEATFPSLLDVSYVRVEELRYGENPHQAAALYRTFAHADAASKPSPFAARPSIAGAEQLHGKELSYNNINDAAAALELAIALARVDPNNPGACVIKHTNPCGAAIAPNLRTAIDAAIAGDPVAAYGGILAVNDAFDLPAAERLQSKEIFLEVIIAPSFEPEALSLLQARWANVRLLAVGDIAPEPARQLELRSIPGGLLVQERDTTLVPGASFEHRAGPAPSVEQVHAAAFLEAVSRALFSNAVVLGGFSPDQPAGSRIVRMFGGGAGQMDRVTSCRLAVEKAGELAKGAVVFSDAFFPFADGPEILAAAGVRTIVHPGGSKRDQETFDLCEAKGITCLTTGVRHFRH